MWETNIALFPTYVVVRTDDLSLITKSDKHGSLNTLIYYGVYCMHFCYNLKARTIAVLAVLCTCENIPEVQFPRINQTDYL